MVLSLLTAFLEEIEECYGENEEEEESCAREGN